MNISLFKDRLRKLWIDLLYFDEFDNDESFFDIGGNSLLAVKVIKELKKDHESLTIVDFFENRSINSLSDFIFKQIDESSKLDEDDENNSIVNDQEDIAIIAMTGRFPGANSVEDLWKNISNSKNSITKFKKDSIHPSVKEEIKNSPNFVNAKGEWEDYDKFDCSLFNITPNEALLMDPQQRKALELCHEAIEYSGLVDYSKRVGVFLSAANSTYAKLVELHPDKIEKAGAFNTMLGLEKDYLATRVSYKLNLTGPALTLQTACSSSLVTVVEAVKAIRRNECEAAIAGGITINAFQNSGYLYQPDGIQSPDGSCRPFDAKSSGTLFTDGGAVVVLKRLSLAIKDQDTIVAVVKGVGINNDGANKMSFMAPSASGQATAIRSAIEDGKINPENIVYLEAHGTGTPIGDPIELKGISDAYKKYTSKKEYAYIGSIKSNLGHTNTAAGITGLVKAALVAKNKEIPAMSHFSKANDKLDIKNSPFKINTKKVDIKKDLFNIGVSSFGVGGTNAHVIIENYNDHSPLIDRDNSDHHIIHFSAKSKDSLDEYESKIIKALKESPKEKWINICNDISLKRYSYKHNRAISIYKNLDNILISKGSKKLEKVCFMFPGQGSQYLNMGKELMAYPVFKNTFNKCCKLFDIHLEESLSSVIDSNSDKLKETKFTQPALFVIEYSMAKLLESLDIKPDLMIGHSIGEYAAATIAGVFKLEDAIKLVAFRGSLMQSLEPGSMLSVSEDYDNYKNDLPKSIQLAASNGPSLTVVAGPDKEIEKFQLLLKSKKINSKILHTSHAFHSNMMDPILETFRDIFKGMTLSKPSIDIYSTVSTQIDPSKMATVDYWVNHIKEPVLFKETIQKVIKLNVFCLEVGPRSTLAILSRKTAMKLGVKDFVSINTLKDSKLNEVHSLNHAVSTLWCNGLIESKKYYYMEATGSSQGAPTYPFAKKELWLDWVDVWQETKTNRKINKNIEVRKKTMTNKQVIDSKLVEIFDEASGLVLTDYDDDMTFLEMGMDSLFLTQISLTLNKELNTNISFRQLAEEHSSFASLSEYLQTLDLDLKIEVEQTHSVEQPQLQINSIQPITASSGGSDIQNLIIQQMQIMQQQLALLSQGSSLPNSTGQSMTLSSNNAHNSSEKKVVSEKTAVDNVKKAYGAIARISTSTKTDLSSEQKEFIKNLFASYIKKTKSSKEFTQKNRLNHADPRVVSGFKPLMKEVTYPIVVKKSKENYLWDIDENKYLDITCGFGSNFFGNGHPEIEKYTIPQLTMGLEIGPQHPLTEDVSKLVCELTSFDRAGFCNTGSEAVLGCMRIARTISGKQKIVSFNGSYHGIHDEVIVRGAKNGRPLPAAPGITKDSVKNMIVLEYGTQESLDFIENNLDDLAAVMVEPVQSRRSDFHPRDFLVKLREITAKNDICFIFDEVITGFRIKVGGAQEYFGVKADLAAYGKVVGGGMPIGVVAGKSKYMDALDGGHWQYGDDSLPTVGVTYFAGTFVRHPLALAAAKGALEIIKNGGNELLDKINKKGDDFAEEMNLFCKLSGIPMRMDNFGALMKPKWKCEVEYSDLLFLALKNEGIHVYDGFPWYINIVHKDEDLKFIIETTKKKLTELQALGFIPDISNKKDKLESKNPPVENAKLLANDKGELGWYVEDQNGKLEKVNKG